MQDESTSWVCWSSLSPTASPAAWARVLMEASLSLATSACMLVGSQIKGNEKERTLVGLF